MQSFESKYSKLMNTAIEDSLIAKKIFIATQQLENFYYSLAISLVQLQSHGNLSLVIIFCH